ncbi:MAG TPA: helicase HerA-like domain-containing protein [Thermoleophilaceae bacterium]|nr:helicase HerA-like domain-containing protein [Thermoleophilaceae bacterium]
MSIDLSGAFAEALASAVVGAPIALVSAAVGLVALTTLNWRGTVAVVPGAVAMALAPLHGAALWPLTAAVVCGALREHWRIEDVRKGQDKGRRARQAIGPFQLARNVRDRRLVVRGLYETDQAYPIGVDQSGAVVCLPLGIDEGRHSLVIGATGSGKTTTLVAAAKAHVDAGCGVVVIDPKGDPALVDRLRRFADGAQRDFMVFSLSGDGGRWNPLAHGTPSELSDKLIAAEDWTEPHYKRLYQRYLLTVFTAIRARADTPDVAMVVDLLKPERLALYARDIHDAVTAERIDRHLCDLTDHERRDLAGLRNRIALLSESELGPLLEPSSDGTDDIDLLTSIRRRTVVVFSLNSSRYPETSKLLGAALFQDVKNAAGVLEADTGDAYSAAVIVDEFSAFGQDHVVGLFQRARSARLSLLLATQELADLRQVDASFQDQVLANVETVVAHRQNVPASAELVAQLAGTRDVWVRTFQTDRSASLSRRGPLTRGTMHRGHEFHVAPDTVKQLDVGQVVVITKNPHAVRIARIQPARGASDPAMESRRGRR